MIRKKKKNLLGRIAHLLVCFLNNALEFDSFECCCCVIGGGGIAGGLLFPFDVVSTEYCFWGGG